MPESWTEKHRPRGLKRVVGNAEAVKAISAWADAWAKGKPPKRRALLLEGPPGSGKTSAALAVAEERGWGLIELNASDARSGDAIKRVAGQGAVHETFSATGEYFDSRQGHRKLIVLDEADNLYERGGEAVAGGVDFSDRGGKRAIVDTIASTRQPIVLIVNDAYALTRGGGSRLNRLALKVRFRRVDARAVARVLGRVAEAEGVRVPPEVLEAIAARAEGDLRSAVNDLQALAEGRDAVSLEDVGTLGQRNRTENVFNAVRAILRGGDAQAAIRATWDVDEPPDFLLTWIDENLPREYQDADDLAAGMDALGTADKYLGRTKRRRAYALWAYASEFMSGGVAAARTRKGGGFVRYAFPTWLRQMSASKGARALRDGTATKLAAHLHTSRRVAIRDALPWMRALYLADAELAERVSLDMDLDADEIEFLMGPEADPATVRKVVAHVQRRREAGTVSDEGFFGESEHAGPVEAGEPAEEEEDEETAAPSKTLLDF